LVAFSITPLTNHFLAVTAAPFRLAVDLDLPPAMSSITLIFGNEAGPLMFQKTDFIHKSKKNFGMGGDAPK
jgi:hypothetical protein